MSIQSPNPDTSILGTRTNTAGLTPEQAGFNLENIGRIRETESSGNTNHEETASDSVPGIDVNKQLVFVGLEAQTKKKPKLKAFGSYVKEGLYTEGFNTIDLSEVEEKTRKWFSVHRLRDIAYGGGKNNSIADKKREYVDGVLLTPTDHKFLYQFTDTLASRVQDRTLASNDISEDQISAAERSQVHAVEGVRDNMVLHRDAMKERELKLIELKKQAKYPGFAHKKPEEMQGLINESWQELESFLDTLQVKMKWTDKQRRIMERVAVEYLNTGSQRDRVAKWQDLLSFQADHLRHRGFIFDKYIKRSNRTLESISSVPQM